MSNKQPLQNQKQYDQFLHKLMRCRMDQQSEKELILLKLKNFYTIDERDVRLEIIEEVRAYLKRLEQEDVLVVDIGDFSDEEADRQFQEIERAIRKSFNNDRTVNFMISGFIQALDTVRSLKVRKRIYEYTRELALHFNRLTGMYYSDNSGGGLVLYQPSLIEPDGPAEPRLIYYYGADVE